MRQTPQYEIPLGLKLFSNQDDGDAVSSVQGVHKKSGFGLGLSLKMMPTEKADSFVESMKHEETIELKVSMLEDEKTSNNSDKVPVNVEVTDMDFDAKELEKNLNEQNTHSVINES